MCFTLDEMTSQPWQVFVIFLKNLNWNIQLSFIPDDRRESIERLCLALFTPKWQSCFKME